MDKIIKLLNLTTSSNDYEALSAIRKANEILKKDNKIWKDVIHSLPKIKSEPTIDQMFASLFGCFPEYKSTDFLFGLYGFYEKNNFLTKNQLSKLKNMYETYCEQD